MAIGALEQESMRKEDLLHMLVDSTFLVALEIGSHSGERMAIEIAKKKYSKKFKMFDKTLNEVKLHGSNLGGMIPAPIPKTFNLNTDAAKQKLKSWVNMKTKLLSSITSAALFSTVMFCSYNHNPLYFYFHL